MIHSSDIRFILLSHNTSGCKSLLGESKSTHSAHIPRAPYQKKDSDRTLGIVYVEGSIYHFLVLRMLFCLRSTGPVSQSAP